MTFRGRLSRMYSNNGEKNERKCEKRQKIPWWNRKNQVHIMGKIQRIRESKTGKTIVKKGKSGIGRILFGRTGIILLLLLLQLGILFIVFSRLQQHIIYAYWLFVLLSALTAILIINRPGNPAFKLAWMVPITFFPVFGMLLYLFVEFQAGTVWLNHRLQNVEQQMRKYVLQDPDVFEELEKTDKRVANLSRYVTEKGGFPTYKNYHTTYYPWGKDKFEALIEELNKAEKFIFMEYFIVAEGKMWNTVLEILKKKVQEGVEVRFMYDGTCSISLLPYNYPKKLEKYGIRCKIFNPIKPALSTVQNNRDHRKIVVIDGKTAFTGGVNLADEYIGELERFGTWKDTAIMVQGEAVRNFTLMFLEIWNVDEPQENYEKYLDASYCYGMTEGEGYVIPYGDSPLDHENVGELVYMDILNSAKDYVHIMTPYLILDHEMLTALTYAAKRGVDVKIIMPGIPDKAYAFALAKTYYPELLRAGVKIYQYKPGFVHAKSFTSDDCKGVVGTINLDYRSLFLHFECAVYLYQVPQIADVEADFQETLKDCREISMEDWKNEKFITKLTGRVLRLIAPLM